MRTTVDIDPSVLAEAKRRAADQGKTLGRLMSELLARALTSGPPALPEFDWQGAPLGARVDLEDWDAVWLLLDADAGTSETSPGASD